MASSDRVFTPAEAAVVSDIDLKSVHNAIDKMIVVSAPHGASGGGKRSSRALTVQDLVRLKIWSGLGGALPAEQRQRVFDAIEGGSQAKTVKAGDFLIIDLAAARRQVAAQLRKLDEAQAQIHWSKDVLGGEAVFKGTRIPVRLIAAMLSQGASETEILEGYPSLKPNALEFAKIWTAAHPPRGRPKRLSDRGFQLKTVKTVPLEGVPLRRPSPKVSESR